MNSRLCIASVQSYKENIDIEKKKKETEVVAAIFHRK